MMLPPLVEDMLIAFGFRRPPLLPVPPLVDVDNIRPNLTPTDRSRLAQHDTRLALLDGRMKRFEIRLRDAEARIGIGPEEHAVDTDQAAG